MERVIVTLPRELLDQTDERAGRLAQKRSRVVRQSLHEWVERQKRQEFEELLAEGYKEMSEHLAELAEEMQLLQAGAVEKVWRWDN